jgi:hypothetical protein
MDDETVSTFTMLTGSTPAQATQYLQLAEGNLEQAAQLWFETGGSLATDSTASTAPPAVPTSTRPSTTQNAGYTEDADGVIHIDSDDEDMNYGESRPAANTEDDEAIARRLQEEMYGTAGRDPEGVRAPIGRTTETLVGPGSMGYGGGYGDDDDDVEAQIAQQIAARQARRAGGGRQYLIAKFQSSTTNNGA